MRQAETEIKYALAGPTPDVESLIGILQAGTRIWRDELGEVSDAARSWQPFKNGHSIGGLLLHVAEVEGRGLEEVAAGRCRSEAEKLELRVADTNPEKERWSSPHQWTIERYYELLDRVRARSITTLRELGDPNQIVNSSCRGPVSLAWIVTFLLGHEAYHAGQMMLHKLHHGWNGIEPG